MNESYIGYWADIADRFVASKKNVFVYHAKNRAQMWSAIYGIGGYMKRLKKAKKTAYKIHRDWETLTYTVKLPNRRTKGMMIYK